MPTRFTELVVDAAEPPVLARFWSALLGWPVTFEDDEESHLEDGGVIIVFGSAPEPKTGKNRVHLDLASSSPEHQAWLVDRAVGLGARHVDIGQGGPMFVVLADPEGNEFCVLEPRPEFAATGAVAVIVQDCA